MYTVGTLTSVLWRRRRDDVELPGLSGQLRLVEVVEVGVLEGVPRRDPPRGVVLQHLLKQVDAHRVQLRNRICIIIRLRNICYEFHEICVNK